MQNPPPSLTEGQRQDHAVTGDDQSAPGSQQMQEAVNDQEPMSREAADATHERHHLLGASQDQHGANSSSKNSTDYDKCTPSIETSPPRTFTLQEWWQELALSAYTVGLLIAIAATLSISNKKSQSTWTLGLNLNTIIALLATFLRSGLVMVVEQVLGQAKWTWQQRSRPLQHLAHFDDASRGPWGSLLLWFRVNPLTSRWFGLGHTAAAFLASITIVLSLAIGSFTQQAVRSVPCTLEAPGANVALPLAYKSPESMARNIAYDEYDTGSSTKARAFNALAGATTDRSTLIQGCSTGNCTFPEIAPGVTHYTSGICSRCVDTTPYIVEQPNDQYNGSSYAYRNPKLMLPNGLEVGPVGEQFNTVKALHTNRTKSFPLLASKIENFSENLPPWNISAATLHVMALTNDGCEVTVNKNQEQFNCTFPKREQNDTSTAGWNAVSATCALYPCVKDMKAEISNGRLNEVIVNEIPISNYAKGEAYGTFKFPCFIDGTRYDEHNVSLVPNTTTRRYTYSKQIPDECYLTVSFGLVQSINSSYEWFGTVMKGRCIMPFMKGKPHSTRYFRKNPQCYDENSNADAWWLTGLYNDGNATFESISSIWENVATAFTDSYRLASIADYGTNAYTTVNGTVWQTTICTQFNWPWLVFPATLVVLTILSLVLMIASPATGPDRPPVWKSSILPLLYLRDTSRESELEGYRSKDMEKSAKDERVELKRDEEQRWQLVHVEKVAADSP